jgi:serine/threonine-protein kinase haspin
MDHVVHGVKATVIDLGLARMDARASDDSTEIRWTPFDEEVFEGEG